MPLQPVCENVWVVGHDVYLPGGVHFPGRMVVVRLGDGSLWLHSPVPIDEALSTELAALGPVAHVVAPCRFHDLFFAQAVARYPDATPWLAPGLAERNPALPAGQTLSVDPAPWGSDLEQHLVGGVPRLSETVFLHRASGTLLVADLMFHMVPSNWQTSLLLWMVGAHSKLAVSRSVGLMTQDAKALSHSAGRILSWDFDRLIMAHGTLVERGAKAAVSEALARFKPAQEADVG